MSSRSRCFSYKELKSITARDNQEPLVDLRTFAPTLCFGVGSDKMVPYVGRGMFLRQGAAERLIKAQEALMKRYPSYRLKVMYAYRHPAVQKSNFDTFLGESRRRFPEYSEEELYEYVHHYMAIPDVGGHPVGAAIDITIEDAGRELSMGSLMADFSDMEKVHTFSKTISEAALGNRLLMRSILMDQGFAPYDFEWWHFSYGDREWACYYDHPETLYDTLDFTTTTSA